MQTMKSPARAFLLSFVIPGLGLAYLGKRRSAALNFLVAVFVPVATYLLWPDTSLDFMHYVVLAIAAGSAGLAHAVGLSQNKAPDAQS
jgi:hypothetical protein